MARLNRILQTEQFFQEKIHAVTNHNHKHTRSQKKKAVSSSVVSVIATQRSFAPVQLSGCLLVLTDNRRLRVLRKFSERKMIEKIKYISLFPLQLRKNPIHLIIHRSPFYHICCTLKLHSELVSLF